MVCCAHFLLTCALLMTSSHCIRRYADQTNEQVITSVMAGQRAAKPAGCSAEFYETVLLCWDEVPSDRPTFEQLVVLFTRQMDCLADADDVDVASGGGGGGGLAQPRDDNEYNMAGDGAKAHSDYNIRGDGTSLADVRDTAQPGEYSIRQTATTPKLTNEYAHLSASSYAADVDDSVGLLQEGEEEEEEEEAEEGGGSAYTI